MAVKYKNLDEERQDTVREIRRDEMLYGVDPGYSVVDGYDPYSADVVAGRGSYGIADNAFMNDADWAAVQGYKQNWANAKTDEERAYWHDMAQQVRYGYGYSGGEDGSQHIGIVANTAGMPSTKGNNEPVRVSSEHAEKLGIGYGNDVNAEKPGISYGSNLNYENAGQYVSQWQDQINALTGAIMGREPFSYNKDTDPLYQQYKESYTRGGQRGMQDTLAQVSARTGGLASSYAQSAAQQTYNNYMAALADKVPELQQLAYSMYMDDIAMDRANLDMLMGLDNTDYGRWSDDRNFNYGVYRDSVADSQWQKNFDYGAYRDSVADSQWQQNFNYQQAQDALAQKNWQSQFDYQMAQDALAQQNWQTQWDYNVLQDELARQDALAKLYAKGGGVEPDSILDTLYGFGTRAEAYDWLVRNGYNTTQAENYLGFYDDHKNSVAANQRLDGLSGDDGTSDPYRIVESRMQGMKDRGVDPQEMAKLLEEAYQSELITKNEYESLRRRYPAY